jgi:peptidyl-prolyl cis-trans isomerase B (cyclophilin B)
MSMRKPPLALSPLLVAALMIFGCSRPTTGEAAAPGDTTARAASSTAASETTTGTEKSETMEQQKPDSYYQDKVAEMKTTEGTITLRFFPDVAPNHVRNFIDLSEQGFYNGTKFHRVVPGFVIQGGDPNTKSGNPNTWGMGNSGKYVKAEFNSVHHARGILSMARSGDPNSASSQFFICVGDAGFLDNQYTAFGQVTSGMDVVDKIVAAPKRGESPLNPVVIESITIRPAKESEKGPTPK